MQLVDGCCPWFPGDVQGRENFRQSPGIVFPMLWQFSSGWVRRISKWKTLSDVTLHHYLHLRRKKAKPKKMELKKCSAEER